MLNLHPLPCWPGQGRKGGRAWTDAQLHQGGGTVPGQTHGPDGAAEGICQGRTGQGCKPAGTGKDRGGEPLENPTVGPVETVESEIPLVAWPVGNQSRLRQMTDFTLTLHGR